MEISIKKVKQGNETFFKGCVSLYVEKDLIWKQVCDILRTSKEDAFEDARNMRDTLIQREKL